MNKTIPIVAAAALVAMGGFYIVSKRGANDADSVVKQNTKPTVTNISEKVTPSTMPAVPAVEVLTLKTAVDANLGTFLVAENGMTLYKYTKDTAGVSNCSGECAVKWPPYVVADVANIKVDPSIKGVLSTVKRDDGTMQVAYNGEPLYYWIKDMKVGDTTGQNVGQVWFVVKP